MPFITQERKKAWLVCPASIRLEGRVTSGGRKKTFVGGNQGKDSEWGSFIGKSVPKDEGILMAEQKKGNFRPGRIFWAVVREKGKKKIGSRRNRCAHSGVGGGGGEQT